MGALLEFAIPFALLALLGLASWLCGYDSRAGGDWHAPTGP